MNISPSNTSGLRYRYRPCPTSTHSLRPTPSNTSSLHYRYQPCPTSTHSLRPTPSNTSNSLRLCIKKTSSYDPRKEIKEFLEQSNDNNINNAIEDIGIENAIDIALFSKETLKLIGDKKSLEKILEKIPMEDIIRYAKEENGYETLNFFNQIEPDAWYQLFEKTSFRNIKLIAKYPEKELDCSSKKNLLTVNPNFSTSLNKILYKIAHPS